MKATLYVKFVLAYLLFGLLSFIAISTVGSELIENHLIEESSNALYREIYTVSDWQSVKQYKVATSQDNLHRNLSAVAAYHDADIMIIDTDGDIVIHTAILNLDHTPVITPFDPADFGPDFYEISTFYGQYSQDQLNIMLPIISNMSTKGYISIHLPMENVYTQREELLRDILTISTIIYILSFIILVLFTIAVYIPVLKIIRGAKEFSRGNLKYRIKVNKSDEIGYLASTLNYMGDELEKHTDYQNAFIANVSHDFRSPLTSIKGYAVAMSDGTIPPELYPKYLGIITSETERLDKLTRSMLTLNDMNKKMVLNKTDFDINAVIQNTVAVFEGICRQKKISVELLLEGEELYVSADVDKIKQVLYNLMDNAVKFSNKNSTITLETTDKHGKVYVSVKDMGEGIPKDAQRKIWDRFYKIDTSRGKDRKGTGLGLAIVKEIIVAHEQNINVISTEGVGTEFIFTLNHSKL